MNLIERLSNEADLCRNDGADDIAKLLDEAVTSMGRLAGCAIGVVGLARMSAAKLSDYKAALDDLEAASLAVTGHNETHA
jgi:hypothetical protein